MKIISFFLFLNIFLLINNTNINEKYYCEPQQNFFLFWEDNPEQNCKTK
jgi:hypothetical protein